MNTPLTTPKITGILSAVLLSTCSVFATNGMNMEGYGPIATSMGGTSMAFDNGTAAVINNPATLTLLEAGQHLDLALGVLGPKITATAPNGASAESQATAFFMPGLGFAQTREGFTWGLAVFGQGGMGCEYEGNSWRGLGYGLKNRTEVSVGRVILPLAYKLNESLSFACTVDYVWAGMDLKMAMSGAQFMDLVTPGQQHMGQASGSLVQGFGQMLEQLPAGSGVNYAYFDFANGSDFTGEAFGSGYAWKLGLLYRPTPSLSLGLSYHAKTQLSDLKAPGNSLSFQLAVPGMGAMTQALAGDIRVNNFEWPALVAAGLAWQVSPDWLLAVDLRQIQWSAVMARFDMSFTASSAIANGPFAGKDLNAILYQNWDDQTVVQMGAAWKASDRWTLRFGFNHGADPIPDAYLNCLFPATVETHLTSGFTYQVSNRSTLSCSLTYGFKHSVTNGGGINIEHEQRNAQLLYSLHF